MKCWKLAALKIAQVLAHCRHRHVHALFFGLLVYVVSAAALASEIQALPSPQLSKLQLVKGSVATPNNALLSPYRVFNSTDGLPQNTVYAMANGPDGRIYVGTGDGLSRFDGGGFTRLHLSQSDLPAAVNAITVIGAQIWIGTDESGLWRGDGEHWQQVALTLPKFAPGDTTSTLPGITAIRARTGSGVWVSTTAGVFSCVANAPSAVGAGAKSDCVFQSSTAGLDVPVIVEGYYHNHSVLWVAAENRGLLAFEIAPDGKLAAVQMQFGQAQGLGNTLIRALANWQGALWIGTGRGLSRLRQNSSGPDEMTFWGRDDSAFAAGVFDLLPSFDAQQQPILLAATYGGGLIQMDQKDDWSALRVAQGLPENQLRSLLQSPGGGPIWIGTASSGIARADPGGWVAYTERHGLPYRSVIGMGKVRFPDAVESYWLGTISGAVRLEKGRWHPFLPAEIAERPIYDIAARSRGGLWLASDVGIFSWDGKILTKFSPDNADLPGFTVLDIERHGKTGALWLALRHGLATIVDDKISAVKDSTFARSLLYVDALAGGSMLVAQDEGLRWIKGDGTSELIRQPCLVHPSTYSMALAAPELGKPVEVWVGGRAGITRLRFNQLGGNSTIQCNQIDAAMLGSNWIFDVKFDAIGDLYAFGYSGALRLRVVELNALEAKAPVSTLDGPLKALKVEHFDQRDGLPDLEFNRGVMLDDAGRIWAANVGGAAIFDPKLQAKSVPNAPFIFTALRVANGPESPDKIDPAKIGAGDILPNGAELHTSYRLLSYSRESKIRYRTQLQGLELQPGDWTADATRNFARLPSGQYVFKVWARDALDRPYGPIELAFSVALPWWRNPWLLLIAATALIYAGASLGRLRADTLKRKALKLAQKLESQVRSRTQELADANVQLEKLALTDPLTGCYNRRCFYERYLQVPQSKDLLIILLDIDFFKKINDEFGHAGGDAVLVQFALRLQQGGAPVFRMGGEEFMILEFAGSKLEQLTTIEKALKQISAAPFDLGAQKINVTTSIGAACFSCQAESAQHVPPGGATLRDSSEQSNRLEHVIRAADAALYQAKQAGRNRAVLVELSQLDLQEQLGKPAGSDVQVTEGRGKFRE